MYYSSSIILALLRVTVFGLPQSVSYSSKEPRELAFGSPLADGDLTSFPRLGSIDSTATAEEEGEQDVLVKLVRRGLDSRDVKPNRDPRGYPWDVDEKVMERERDEARSKLPADYNSRFEQCIGPLPWVNMIMGFLPLPPSPPLLSTQITQTKRSKRERRGFKSYQLNGDDCRYNCSVE